MPGDVHDSILAAPSLRKIQAKIFFPNKGSYNERGLFVLIVVLLDTLGLVVLFGKFLVAKKFGVHALFGNKLGLLGLLDSIGVGLAGVVVCARVL